MVECHCAPPAWGVACTPTESKTRGVNALLLHHRHPHTKKVLVNPVSQSFLPHENLTEHQDQHPVSAYLNSRNRVFHEPNATRRPQKCNDATSIQEEPLVTFYNNSNGVTILHK
ncbi:hypothetical protein MN608_08752 [Microdochium nivale]|nr:hypothetical protein MN608_08752 [Microdochium nivale]